MFQRAFFPIKTDITGIRSCRHLQVRRVSQRAKVTYDFSETISLKSPNENSSLPVHTVWLRHHYVKNVKIVTFSPFLVENHGLSQQLLPKYSYNKNVESTLNDPIEVAIHFDEFMKEGNDGVAHLLSKILRYGFGIVNHCPSDFEVTKKVILKVLHPQNTIYGDFSEWTSNLAHADTAYTSDIVHMHTDTSYFTEPIGSYWGYLQQYSGTWFTSCSCSFTKLKLNFGRLQIFHCLAHNGTGGLNSLVDGFQIAKQISQDNPEWYHLLSTIPIPSQYVDEGKHHFHNNDVTFAHDKTSYQIQKIRYNPHDMVVLKDLPLEHVEKFYESLVNLSDQFESSPQPIKLTPGLVIFLDNWRILHGRPAYTGFRHLCGAYISRSDWLSRARTLGLLKDY